MRAVLNANLLRLYCVLGLGDFRVSTAVACRRGGKRVTGPGHPSPRGASKEWNYKNWNAV